MQGDEEDEEDAEEESEEAPRFAFFGGRGQQSQATQAERSYKAQQPGPKRGTRQIKQQPARWVVVSGAATLHMLPAALLPVHVPPVLGISRSTYTECCGPQGSFTLAIMRCGCAGPSLRCLRRIGSGSRCAPSWSRSPRSTRTPRRKRAAPRSSSSETSHVHSLHRMCKQVRYRHHSIPCALHCMHIACHYYFWGCRRSVWSCVAKCIIHFFCSTCAMMSLPGC